MQCHVPRSDTWMWIEIWWKYSKSFVHFLSCHHAFKRSKLCPEGEWPRLQTHSQTPMQQRKNHYGKNCKLPNDKYLLNIIVGLRRDAIANIKFDVKKMRNDWTHSRQTREMNADGPQNTLHGLCFMQFPQLSPNNCYFVKYTALSAIYDYNTCVWAILWATDRVHCHRSTFVSITVSWNGWMCVFVWLLSMTRIRFGVMLIVQPDWIERHCVALHVARI